MLTMQINIPNFFLLQFKIITNLYLTCFHYNYNAVSCPCCSVVNLVQFLLLLLVSPLGLVYIGSVVNEVVVEKVTDAAVLLPRAWESTQSALLMALINNNLFANWTFSLVSLVIFPTWLMFWSLLWTKPH